MITPGSYRADPWGWAGNQCGHAVLGFVTLMVLTYVYFAQFGEFPHRECLIGAVAFGYLAFELATQGWYGWDTVEDWFFFTIYGGMAPALASAEVAVGSAVLSVDISTLWPFTALFIAHCAIGFGVRAWRARNDVG